MRKAIMAALVVAAALVMFPSVVRGDSTDAPGRVSLVGGWIGGAAYGPERDAHKRINVGTFAAVEVFRLTKTSSLFAAYQYYHVGGTGASASLDATGWKALYSNKITGTEGTIILGGGFLDDVKAQLGTIVSEDKSTEEPTVEMSNGLEFDVGIAWPVGDQVDLIVMLMAIDRGDLGTAINVNVAAGIKNPLSIITGAVGL